MNGSPGVHMLFALVEYDGDNWARMVLTKYPGALEHARLCCDDCRVELERLFPEGAPNLKWNGPPPQVEEVLEIVRQEAKQDNPDII